MNKKLLGMLGVSLFSLLLFVTGPVEAYTFSSNQEFYSSDSSYYYREQDYYNSDKLENSPIPTEPIQPTIQLPVYTKSGTYTVQWGDTLWLISQKLGVSLTSLRQINNIWNEAIYPGEVLYYDKIYQSTGIKENSYSE